MISRVLRRVHEREYERLEDWALIWLPPETVDRAVCDVMGDLIYSGCQGDKSPWGPLGMAVFQLWMKIRVRCEARGIEVHPDGRSMLATPTRAELWEIACVYAAAGAAARRAGISYEDKYWFARWLEYEHGVESNIQREPWDHESELLTRAPWERMRALMDQGEHQQDAWIDIIRADATQAMSASLNWASKIWIGKELL